MNDDDRLTQYLSDRAQGIHLAPGDATEVMRRGSRRRQRRRGAMLGAVAVLAVVATTTLLQRGGNDQKVVLGAHAQATASTYKWSVVKPTSGLAYSQSHAQLANGAIYGLSTAPGPVTSTSDNRSSVLYRSSDGADWVPAPLPSGLSTSALAASGDTLYALGTAPAGGGARDLVVAASTDGAASWTSVTLPHELADLEARHPGQISLSMPALAAKDATHQVATVVVSANIDPTKAKPELANRNVTWEWTDTGLTVFEAPAPCKANGVTSTTAVVGSPADGTKSAVAEAEACRANASGSVTTDANGNGPVVATYTWNDLGVDAELAGLVNGRTYTYATDDGTHFSAVTLPGVGHGWGTQLVAGADGYTLFFGNAVMKHSSTDVLRSADGHTWTKLTSFGGSPMSAGLLSGRPAVALSGDDGHTTVETQQPDGSWTPLDLASAVPAPSTTAGKGTQVWVGEVAFGPLGVAGTVNTIDANGTGPSAVWVVHSADGVHLLVLSVKDKVPDAGVPLGISVTADAITVRLSNVTPNQPPTTPPTPPTETVLVGTPSG